MMFAGMYDISYFFIILPGVLVDLLTLVVEISYLFCLLTISLTLKNVKTRYAPLSKVVFK